MSLILYNSTDDFSDEWGELPPHSSSSLSNSFEMKGTLTFTVQSIENWLKIENFIRLRNRSRVFSNGTNINGANIGDYTCPVQDKVTGKKFFAILEFSRENSSDTRFFNNGNWEKDGVTFTINVTEVQKYD